MEGKYGLAYKACFQVRVCLWVEHDHPNVDHGLTRLWAGVEAEKTFLNYRSHLNGARKSLEWLRSLSSPSEEDKVTMNALGFLVDGPLEAQPVEALADDDLEDHIRIALSWNLSKLAKINKEIKSRKAMSGV